VVFFIKAQKTGWVLGIVYVLIMILSIMMSNLMPILLIVLPVLLIMMVKNQQWRTWILSLSLGMLLAMLSSNWVLYWIFTLFAAVEGWLLGRGIERKEVGYQIVNSTLIWIAFFLSLILLFNASGLNLLSQLTKQMVNEIQSSSFLMALNQSGLQGIDLTTLISTMIPSVFIVCSILITLIHVIIVRIWETARDPQSTSVMRHFKMPKRSAALYGFLILVMVFTPSNSDFVGQAISTAFMVMTFLFALQAMSLLWWLLKEKARQLPLVVQIIIGVAGASLIIIILLEIFMIIGIIDNIIDLRKRLSKSKEE
jgi:hypothetical protein